MTGIGRSTEISFALRQLDRASRELSSAQQRLSSGLRINSPSDDPAGLAVGTTLRHGTRLASRAIRNVNDGISFLNVVDSGVSSLKTILGRAKEIATQAANGAYGDNQRAALDAELQALGEEYNRIIKTTAFNGANALKTGTTPTRIHGNLDGTPGLDLLFAPDPTYDVTRGNVSASGAQANGTSLRFNMSGNGRFITFQSAANNLVPGDTNGQSDVFVKDLETGEVTIVSRASDGTLGNSASTESQISYDGRYVVFESSASNLVAGDSNGNSDIFMHDRVTGTTTRVSLTDAGLQANGNSFLPQISADGRYVAFSSAGTNLVAGDTNGVLDIFVRDTVAGTTTRVSVATGGAQGNSISRFSDMSDDGRYVTFESSASNLVAGDTNGGLDVFVHDLVTSTTTRVNVDSAGAQTGGASNGFISGNGRYVFFSTPDATLVAGDTNGISDIFRKDLVTGEVIRVTLNSNGEQTNGFSGLADSAAASFDGNYVVFSSAATNLDTTLPDTNGVYDVFVRNIKEGITTRVNLAFDGTEANSSSELYADISGDGRTVVYQSFASNLVPGDTNGQFDAFVASNTAFGAGYDLTQLDGVSVTSQAQAQTTISTLDFYDTQLARITGKVGSYLSRLEIASSNLQAVATSYEGAASRILDADVAGEVARMVRANILQQSGAALLASHRQNSRNVLQLLEL